MTAPTACRGRVRLRKGWVWASREKKGAVGIAMERNILIRGNAGALHAAGRCHPNCIAPWRNPVRRSYAATSEFHPRYRCRQRLCPYRS